MSDLSKNSSKFIHMKPIQPDDLRLATLELLGLARQFIGAEKWEAPQGNRKNWRRRQPDGSYEYRETPPDGKQPKQQPSVVKQVNKPVDAPSKSEKPAKKIVYKNYLKMDKPKLQETLTKGHFSIISAGKNGADPKEAKMSPDDPFFHKRHEELRTELEKQGLSYTEAVGHYGSQEPSFLVFHDDTELTPKTQKSVMVHHKDADEAKRNRKVLEELGKKFNQDSVLHGSNGRNEIVFTTGKKSGVTCGGHGWKEVPHAKDYYTDISLEGKNHTKFTLDLSDCFKRGLL